MNKTVYTNLTDINELQTNIMQFISWWIHEKKTPIPRSEIIKKMQQAGVNMFDTLKSL